MAFNEDLARRVRTFLSGREGITEKKMFGGLAFMLDGNMCCGIVGDDLMVRVGADSHEEVLRQPHARPMDFTGRPSKGMVFVGKNGTDDDDALSDWVDRAIYFVSALPPK